MLLSLGHKCRSLARLGAAWSARQHSDLWKLLIIAYFISLGFHQVLKPFCDGESHGLPDDSRVARVYPCDGGIFNQVCVLLTNPWAFWRDLARLKLSEQWSTVETYFLLPRIGCALLLPRHVYHSAAPILAAVHRGLGPATMVVLSFIAAQRPSDLTVWGMRTWPFMDIGFNSMFPTTPLVELVYGILSLAWMLILCTRYQYMFPDMSLQLPFKLMSCVVSTAWLVMFEVYRRRISKKRHHGQYLLDKCSGGPSGSSGMADAYLGGRAVSRSTGDPTVLGGAKPSGPLGLTESHAPHTHVSYSALPGRYFSIHVKIDNAEPEQIRGGYRDRIAHVLAAAGLHMQHLYVRRGCIELTVDARADDGEAEPDDSSAAAAAGNCDIDIGALIRALQLDGQEGADDTDSSRLQRDNTAETTLWEPGSTDDTSSESLSSSATGFEIDELNKPRLLATECHAWGSRQGQGLDPLGMPRITGLHPRVVAVPPPPPAAAAAAAVAEGPTTELVVSVVWPSPYDGRLAGARGSEAASGGPHDDGGGRVSSSRELVLRSQGLYLPISVDSSAVALAGTSGGHADDDGCPFGLSDSSAAPDVAPRQSYLYNVQVSGLPPCTGLMLAEARLDGRVCSRPVPVLIVDDPWVAQELAAAFVEWGGTADELDALVADLGTFFSQATKVVARQQQLLAQQTPPCGGAGGGGSSSNSAALQVWRLGNMGDHLLQYALTCSWQRTATRLRDDLQLLGQARAIGQHSSGTTTTCSSGDSPQAATGDDIAACPKACASCGPTADGATGAAGPAKAGTSGAPASSMEIEPGAETAACCPADPERQEPCGPSHEDGALRAAGGTGPQRPLRDADAASSLWSALHEDLNAHFLIVELAALLTLPLLQYWRPPNLEGSAGGAAAILLLLGCVCAAAGGLRFFPRRDLATLLKRSAQPRLALYLLVRSLQGALGWPAPAALQAYERGIAFMVMEGVARPALLMVGSTAAARIEALKFPFYLLLWAPNLDPWSTAARAAAVTSLSVVTTFACARLLQSYAASGAAMTRK